MFQRHKLSRFAVTASAILALVMSPLLAAPPANAWSTTDFNAGRIIDDALFYDGQALSAPQVQSFLNEKLPQCWLGRPGYEIGKPVVWGGTPTRLASKCTKDYRVTTTSRAANDYCRAYAGAPNETAAQIIYKVGQACNVSQKVLLVMLDKEQSLVSDPWPNEEQYFRAMGYACPDSGPGGTANCDPAQGGFYQQVYRAAWQLQVYKAEWQSYRYKPKQSNTIQWHPNLGCGTSQVYIENWATAALYIYTPYRPNQAALNAGWAASSDPCATYGNRNFFNYYNAWFGSTTAQPAVVGGIKVIWDRALAAGYSYGSPLEDRRWVASNGTGWQQRFEHGVITESRSLNRTFGLPRGKFSEAYIASGGAAGAWGFIAGDAEGDTAAGSRAVKTQWGTLIYTVPRGVQFLPATVHSVWQSTGGFRGPLGYPTEQYVSPSPAAASQRFESGATIMTSGSAGTVVSPAQLAEWTALGGYPRLGFYIKDPVKLGQRFYRDTEHGTMFFGGDSPLYLGFGLFLTNYVNAGGPLGSWGWPTTEKQPVDAGASTVGFEGGIALHSPRYGLHFLARQPNGHPVPLLVDADHSQFAEEIRWMAGAGISTGYSIEYGVAEFRPGAQVTREAMAAFLYRYAGQPQYTPPAVSPFIDVPTSHVYYKEISWLASRGISTGWETANGKTYRPYDFVARDAMAAFLYRFSGEPSFETPPTSSFADVGEDQPYLKEISWLASSGVSTGWSVGSGQWVFRPYASIDRDAMAAFIYRHNRMQ